MAEPAWKRLPIVAPDAKEEPAWKSLPVVEDVAMLREGLDPDIAPNENAGPFEDPGGSPLGKAKARERGLENILTFFGAGGPTAIAKGVQSAMLWPAAPSGRREGEGPLDLYRRKRDEATSDLRRASEHGPHVEADLPLVGHVRVNPVELAGAAAPSLIAPNPAGIVPRLGLGGFLGAQGAAQNSKADLTRGEVLPFLKDVGYGAGTGVATTGIMEGVTAPMRSISKGAAARIGDEVSGQASRDVAQVGKEVKHLEGVAGAETQKGSRIGENIDRHANGQSIDPSGVADPEQLMSISAREEPWAKALRDAVAAKMRKIGPGQKAVMDRTAAEAEAARLSAPQDASNRTRDYFAQSTWGTQIKPRLTTLGENTALGAAAGTATGGAAGLFRSGVEGLADGVISGIGGSALSGGSGLKTLAKNAMASPLVRTSALTKLIQASQGAQGALQKGAQVTSRLRQPDEDDEDAIQAFLSGN